MKIHHNPKILVRLLESYLVESYTVACGKVLTSPTDSALIDLTNSAKIVSLFKRAEPKDVEYMATSMGHLGVDQWAEYVREYLSKVGVEDEDMPVGVFDEQPKVEAEKPWLPLTAAGGLAWIRHDGSGWPGAVVVPDPRPYKVAVLLRMEQTAQSYGHQEYEPEYTKQNHRWTWDSGTKGTSDVVAYCWIH